MGEHTVQIARRPEEEWGALHSIYDDLLTYQVLICPNIQQSVAQHFGSYWRNVPLLPVRSDRSFLDRSCFITKGTNGLTSGTGNEKDSPRPSAGSNQSVNPTSSAGSATTSSSSASANTKQPTANLAEDKKSILNTNSIHSSTTNLKTGDANIAKKSSVVGGVLDETLCSSDEDEGGSTKVLAPKMKATLQRRVARAKRSIAYQVVSAPSWRWDAVRSVRHNQDLQRDRESHIMRDLTAWLSMARSPDSAAIKPSNNETSARSNHGHTSGKHDSKRKEPPAISPGIQIFTYVQEVAERDHDIF